MFWERIQYPVNPDNPVGIRPSPGRSLLGRPAVSSDISTPDQLKGRPLGRVLVRMGKVSREQVVMALVYQRKHGGLMGEVIMRLGFVQPADVQMALAAQRGESP
ncbi:hypothetical protein [Humisphaera borealis]|uniref:Type II secretion system protein GspE N-terminal domain-containing protein n=1 Tax=Humisphaera borealis TaxID=2807512 RepID=A0A7M2WY94_9BACT|nr:hypothetical protein [Humisphaera borealis]QOV90487.1 hypothetical protein IPV69_03725 [Humisphaera borealis]